MKEINTNIIPKEIFKLKKATHCAVCKKLIKNESFGYACTTYKFLFCSLKCCLESFNFACCSGNNHIHQSVVFKEVKVNG